MFLSLVFTSLACHRTCRHGARLSLYRVVRALRSKGYTRRPPTGDVRKHGYHIFCSPLLVAKIVGHRGRVEIPVVFAIRAATVFAQPALPPFARHKACATGGPSTRAGTPRLTKDAIAAAKIGCAIIGIRVG